MDVAADLLRQAARYRTLATRVTDEQSRGGLRTLAEKYEALAAEMQGEGRGTTDPDGTHSALQRS